MTKLAKKIINANRRSNRTRQRLHGSSERPRLSVNISNTHITAQLINDDKAETMAYASSVGKKNLNGTMIERSATIGSEIASKAQKLGVKYAILDRGHKLYHGRMKALADAAREGGLKI